MGDRGGTATPITVISTCAILYPMGDRGGTATGSERIHRRADYTRWEIGGEPQPLPQYSASCSNYTRWEIGGEPQHWRIESWRIEYYTRWEIGGEPQLRRGKGQARQDYTRWEIGGEPQPDVRYYNNAKIIPDGRSGGNRNRCASPG